LPNLKVFKFSFSHVVLLCSNFYISELNLTA